MTKDEVLKALRQAYNLGQIYWQQADSEYISQHKKADQTEAKFQDLLDTTVAALEAKDEPMEFFDWYDNAHWGNEDFKEGCHRAWNAAIKYTAKPNQEAKDEPVAWMFQHEETGRTMCVDAQQLKWGFEKGNPRLKKIAPLYTTPPQRTWAGLTDEEVWECYSGQGSVFYKAIEAKLKEKNG